MSSIHENNFNCVRCTRNKKIIELGSTSSYHGDERLKSFFSAGHKNKKKSIFNFTVGVASPDVTHLSIYLQYWAISSFLMFTRICHKTKTFTHTNSLKAFSLLYLLFTFIFSSHMRKSKKRDGKTSKSTSTNWYNTKKNWCTMKWHKID